MKGNKMKMNKRGRTGRLIVITGPDGSGKRTQTSLLMKKLKEDNYNIETIDFPQYKRNFFGKIVGDYLAGKFGDPTKVNSYLASILYAGDRWESMNLIYKWIKDYEKIVVCDRYVGDNFLHQGSKIKDKTKREEFFQWLYDLEFNIFDAKEADMTLYLDVPLEISLKLLEEKDTKERKCYTGGKKDGHENEKHLRQVRRISESLVKRFAWIKIDCAPEGKLLPPEQISDKIWEKVQPILNS